MAFHGRTPEALLGRSDSKNPATTCKGITGSGRPCRRALALSPNRRKSTAGVVALTESDGGGVEVEGYCWQHKDQAPKAEEVVEPAHRKKKTELFPLQERNSIDTLVQRLGVQGVGSDLSGEQTKVKRKEKPPWRPSPTQAPHAEKYDFVPPAKRRDRQKQKKASFWSALCCMSGDADDERIEIVRHKKRIEAQQSQPGPMSRPASASYSSRPPIPSDRPSSTSASGRRPVSQVPFRPSPNHRTSSNSQTHNLLSLIPQDLSPQTTSALLTELSKPPYPNDEEGYIYIFWLTPQDKSAPEETTARSLLSFPQQTSRSRRLSDVMTEYSFSEETTREGGSGKKTILLKIGRANNVHRRMTEWQRQCGYSLTLVRWYPYVSSSAAPSPVASPSPRRPSQGLYPDLSQRPPTSRRESGIVRKVPRVKRVERLIHLELAEKQAKHVCEACGKEHREWFAVDASEKGVRAVDEVVRRWVGWGERQVL